MATILYKEINGKVVKTPIGVTSRGSDPVISLPLKERMQKTLYNLECEQGSRFNIPGYSKAELRKAWWDMEVRE